MSSSQDKNLPATPRKLQQARDDGQAARSRDLSHLAILGVGVAAMYALAPHVYDYLERGMRKSLVFDSRAVFSPQHMLERLTDMIGLGVLVSGLFALITSVVAVGSAIAAGGWVFSLKALRPQFNRLDPIQGVSRLFSKQQVTNVAKMVFMSSIIIFIAWKYMGNSVEAMAALVLQPTAVSLGFASMWLIKGVGLMLLVLLFFAVVDVPLQAFFFKSRLKMSHEEVKQEHKNAEGSPEIKGKIRQKQREIANRASVANVPNADFVVMNPTHYAVALRYDETSMAAPQVVSKGADLLAFQIRDIAQQHNVPVLQSPMLARALYAHAELERPIPAPLYTAVAQVLAYVYRLKAAMRGEGRFPEAQPDPVVPPELDPHSPQAQLASKARPHSTRSQDTDDAAIARSPSV